MGALGRRTGRISKENEGGGLGGLFGKGIVEYQAEHAAVSCSHVESAHRHLIRLTFPNPFHMYEALGAELFLCSTRVFSGETVFRSSGSGVAMVEGGGGEFVDVRAEAARPRAGVLDDTEVAILAQGEYVRFEESSLATSRSRDSWETGEKRTYMDFLCG